MTRQFLTRLLLLHYSCQVSRADSVWKVGRAEPTVALLLPRARGLIVSRDGIPLD